MVNSFIGLLIGMIFGGLGLLGLHEITPKPVLPLPVAPQTAPVEPAEAIGGYTNPDVALGATNANSLETTIALFETTLANGISKTATTMTLTSATTKDGTVLASSTYAFIIDEGTPLQEFVRADCTGTTCTNMERGISVLSGTTSLVALEQKHNRGASVKITTGPSVIEITNLLNGMQSIRSGLLFDKIATYTVAPSFTQGSNQLVSAAYAETYANNVISGGAPTSTTVVGGKVRLATQLQMSSSTDLGITAPLVLQAKYATSTCAVATSSVVVTGNAGKISQGCLDLTQSFTFSGGLLSTASTTVNATTTLAANIAVGKGLVENGVAYTAPSVQGGVGSILTNNGSGVQSWGTSPRYTVAGAAGASIGTNTAGFATSSIQMNVPANILSASSTIDIYGTLNCVNSSGSHSCNVFVRDSLGHTFATLNTTPSSAGNISGPFHAIISFINTTASEQTYITGQMIQTSGTITSANFQTIDIFSASSINLANATTITVVVQSADTNGGTTNIGNVQYIVNP